MLAALSVPDAQSRILAPLGKRELGALYSTSREVRERVILSLVAKGPLGPVRPLYPWRVLKLPQLKHLELRDFRLPGEIFALLRTLSLRSLDLSGTAWDRPENGNPFALSSLRELRLSHQTYAATRERLDPLTVWNRARMPNLRTLELKNPDRLNQENQPIEELKEFCPRLRLFIYMSFSIWGGSAPTSARLV